MASFSKLQLVELVILNAFFSGWAQIGTLCLSMLVLPFFGVVQFRNSGLSIHAIACRVAF